MRTNPIGLFAAMATFIVSSAAWAGGTYDRTYSTTTVFGKKLDAPFVGSRTNANAFDMGSFKGADITKYRGAFLGERAGRAPIGIGVVTMRGKSSAGASPVLKRVLSVHLGGFNFRRQVHEVQASATHAKSKYSTWSVGWNGRHASREVIRSSSGRGTATVDFHASRDGELVTAKPLYTGPKVVRYSPPR